MSESRRQSGSQIHVSDSYIGWNPCPDPPTSHQPFFSTLIKGIDTHGHEGFLNLRQQKSLVLHTSCLLRL